MAAQGCIKRCRPNLGHKSIFLAYSQGDSPANNPLFNLNFSVALVKAIIAGLNSPA